MFRQAISALILAFWLTVPAFAQKSAKDPLLAGWLNPPADCKMRMFWRVFGPAWTKDEIDYQFGELKKAGIGGVTTFFFYPVALDDPAKGIKNQKFLSPEFLETLSYATRRAKQMGLRFSVAGGTGWPFGGPTVKEYHAAQRIRRMIFPPEPDGSGWKFPQLKIHETCIAMFDGNRRLNEPGPNSGVSIKLVVEGTERATRPLTAFIVGPTGMQVKRPAYGAEGLVVDHYDWRAAKDYLDAVVAPMLKAAPGCIESVFCDSMEVYNSNWTHDFPEQFKKRRGYDIVPLLPVLFDERKAEGERGRGGVGEKRAEQPSARTSTNGIGHSPLTTHHSPSSKDVRFDCWRTLAELTEERFTKPLSQWCHAHGVKLEMEAYGTPPNPLTAAQYIDVPTGEQYEWKGFSFSRWAASGAHLTGKRVIGAEAWTWTGIPNRLADSLADLKLCSDYHFLAGINDLTGVEFPYSPRSAGQPGWLPYFGPVMNQNNPQWPFFHYLVEYVNRCQWMLRQGKPVADVAIYLPVEDKMANGPVEQMTLDFLVRDHFVSGKLTGEFGLKNAQEHYSNLIQSLLTNGLQFDGIDFWAMNRLAVVKGGRVICGDGDYGMLILPNLDGIDLGALQKIALFVRGGGILIATRRLPEQAYDRLSAGEETARVRKLIRELFGKDAGVSGKGTTANRYGEGYAIFAPDDNFLPPRHLMKGGDVILMPNQREVSYVHRRVAGREIYFVTNTSDNPVSFDFVVDQRYLPSSSASLWDPVTGDIRPLNSRGLMGMWERLRLGPRGSIFVVLDRKLRGKDSSEGPPSDFDNVQLPLDAPWQVVFVGPESPIQRELQGLTSWTAWPDARYFSGQATYRRELSWEQPLPIRAMLRLGEVREVAEVRLNGRIAGVVMLPQQEIDVTKLLRRGKNFLEITVANLPINRYLGLPDEDLKPLRAVYGNRFPDPQEKRIMKEPAPSGLIGPVTLVRLTPR